MLTEKDLSMLPIVLADVDVEDSLIAMCKQAEILLNCVGPVRNYCTCFDLVARIVNELTWKNLAFIIMCKL